MNENHFRQHKNPKKNDKCMNSTTGRAKTVTNCKIQSRKRNSFYQSEFMAVNNRQKNCSHDTSGFDEDAGQIP